MRSKEPGRKIHCPTGYTAFVPNPLPPELAWTPQLVRCLSEADRLLGKLAGEGGRLPNPHLLMRPFIRREAVLSSRIEGTQATLGELLAAEVGAFIDRAPDDLKEVGNYVVALEYGMKRLKKLPLCLRLMRELHQKLMTGVRGERATPGEFRRTQNWIGSPGCTLENAAYVPPPPTELMACLGEWENFLHNRTMPPLVQAALAHYQFEAIHPFLDGNGRVGRLFIVLFFVERNILPTPLLYISAFFEATRRDYYDHLIGVTERGKWGEWLEYFLNAVARQAEDALDRATRINCLFDKWRRETTALQTKAPSMLLDRLLANPFITTKTATKNLGVAFTTAQRAIDRLQKLSILKEVSGGQRNRVYCAKAIMDILEEASFVGKGSK